MAKTLQNLTPIFFFFFFFPLTIANAHDDHTFAKTSTPENLEVKPVKLTHLHFYFHDNITGRIPTSVRVAGGPKVKNKPLTDFSAVLNFGTVVVMDDPLTVGPEPTSKLVGRAQGIYSTASQTEVAFLMVLNYVFLEGKYNGSTLSILGRNSILSKVREMPIVGGSGIFRFAKGCAQARTYSFNTTNGDAVVEYNVYVYHY
ncbi:dirigent protein 21-like [Ziziphus jujuba]|uniref:Dirigent protein n=1 Tax=Ziziphus jujuba TaxID=326968 RepID=A0A6P4BQB0_ZIZJJ|nr:dirigent protein 21-like [Ziziphus jujuba]